MMIAEHNLIRKEFSVQNCRRFSSPAAASRYAPEFRRRHFRDWREKRAIARAMGYVPKGAHVLDLPCGTGRLTRLLLQAGFKVTCADLSKEMLELATKMEESSAHDYNLWANECSANADSVSKKLFESLVEDEERHGDNYDVEMENLVKFGDNYLALQSIERSRNMASGNPTD